MRALIIATAFALLVSLAVDVGAQRTGTRVGKTIPRTKPELVFDAMTSCFIKKHEKFARSLLKTAPGSADETKLMNSISGALDLCMNQPDLVFYGNELAFDQNRFRRAIAAALSRLNVTAAPDLAPASEPNRYWTPERLAAFSDHDKTAIEITHYAQCVVSKDWANAKALVLAKPKSDIAKSAAKALKQPLADCLVPNATLKIDRRLLPHLVGEGIYYQLLADDRSS
jgi:hypothetical protein